MWVYFKIAVIFLMVYRTVVCEACSDGCRCQNDVMTCDVVIPPVLPTGIRSVFITNWACLFTEYGFKDHSWRTVLSLDLSSPKGDRTTNLFIRNNTFTNLRSLQFLGMHITCSYHDLDVVDSGAFYGLDKVIEVDFSNSERFSFDVLYAHLKDLNNLRNIRTLKLNSFTTYEYASLCFNSTFQTLLSLRGVTHIEAMNTYIKELYFDSYHKMCSTLKTVNIRDSIIAQLSYQKTLNACSSIRNLDISGTKHVYGKANLHNNYLSKHLDGRNEKPVVAYHQLIETVRQQTQYESKMLRSNNESDCEMDIKKDHNIEQTINQFRKLTSLAMDRLNDKVMFPPCVIKFNVSRAVNLSCENLSVQYNNAHILDFLLISYVTFNFLSINLSYNNISYFGKRVAIPFSSIRHLNVSHNSLFKMENGSEHQLGDMFEHLVNLQTVDLSFNGLAIIPETMFVTVYQIQSIYLNNNKLKQFSQKLLISAEYVDLSANSIETLDEKSMSWLNNMYAKRGNQTMFTVNLQNNPLMCICDNLLFLKWYVEAKFLVNTSRQTCQWNGKIEKLNQQLYLTIDNECSSPGRRRKQIIIISVIVTFVIIIGITAFLSGNRMKQTVVKRRKIARVRDLLSRDEFSYRYVAYMFEAEGESEHVRDRIHSFKHELENRFGFGRNMICTTRLDYIGSRFQEVFSLKNRAAVVIAIVTNNFCNCSVSKYVLETAYEESKPVVIVYVNDASIEHIQPPLFELARCSPVVKLTTRGGDIKWYPPTDRICEMLLELAHTKLSDAIATSNEDVESPMVTDNEYIDYSTYSVPGHRR